MIFYRTAQISNYIVTGRRDFTEYASYKAGRINKQILIRTLLDAAQICISLPGKPIKCNQMAQSNRA
jgi:hypothetical protein